MDDEYTCRDERARRELLRRYEERVDALFTACAEARDLLAGCWGALARQLGARRPARR